MWPDLASVCFSEVVVLNIEPTRYWTQLLTGGLNLKFLMFHMASFFFSFWNYQGLGTVLIYCNKKLLCSRWSVCCFPSVTGLQGFTLHILTYRISSSVHPDPAVVYTCSSTVHLGVLVNFSIVLWSVLDHIISTTCRCHFSYPSFAYDPWGISLEAIIHTYGLAPIVASVGITGLISELVILETNTNGLQNTTFLTMLCLFILFSKVIIILMYFFFDKFDIIFTCLI
jgi:hypothetical protein